ncbi:MAG TPA: helix-turn-helix domain-containing protein [Solirubrobacterales bacterium]|jgi:hypothetical protein|nr:helix-turn-helix domain-containing protein [Solirubrobacterales bacterium]
MRIEEIRRGLAPRLRARRSEIEQATLTRVSSIADPKEKPDPEYIEGIRAAVSAAIEFGIEAVERSEEHPPPIPTTLLSQARLAARHGVKLETVLRRYLAGYTLLGDFLIEESERSGALDGASLKRLLRVQAALLDRLIAAVSEEYEREAKAKPGSAEQRLARRVEQLLEGQRLDTSEIAYEFDAVHLGLVARGPDAEEAVRELARPLDRRLLLVPRGEATVWAWLGGRRALDPESLRCVLSSKLPPGLCLALGESAEGLGGWRLSHRQAKAGLPVAREGPDPVVGYADVALLASVLQDELLATSLREIYLVPLDEGSDGGELARETLRAYLAAEGNVSSTAAALRVNRKTVASRLRAVEAAIGRPISSRLAEIGAALRIEDARAAALAQRRPSR